MVFGGFWRTRESGEFDVFLCVKFNFKRQKDEKIAHDFLTFHGNVIKFPGLAQDHPYDIPEKILSKPGIR